MTSEFFTYEKGKVIQALRYHFITRREIKIMMILVNVFAVLSAALFFFRKISPFAFLVSSLLWFGLMITFWFILPLTIYRRTATFRDRFRVSFEGDTFRLETDRSIRSWNWKEFRSWMESPHFFHLYFNPRSFFIIPRDAFGATEQDAARKMLQEKIGKAG